MKKHKNSKDGLDTICLKCHNAFNLALKKQKPWYRFWSRAYNRCNMPSHGESYHRYGGKGIRFELKPKDVEQIWFRDNAAKMVKPSLDRINSKGNYTLENCRFIEFIENCRQGGSTTRRVWQERRQDQASCDRINQ